MALLQLALAGDVQVAISEPILDETVRVLREKFQWSVSELAGVLAVIDACTYRVTPKRTLHVIAEDEPDNRILECAVEGSCEYIVSGDLHLLRRRNYEGIQIVRVGEFLEPRLHLP
jgi:putative PIN family toxin of toxin-antitoxin system